MAWKKSPESLIEHFLSSTIDLEGVDHRKMFGYPCCFVNGNMFTGLHESNWVLRLPEAGREKLSEMGGKPFKPLGRHMREYLIIPQEILMEEEALIDWLNASLSYAASLPVKTKKK